MKKDGSRAYIVAFVYLLLKYGIPHRVDDSLISG
jgi:hypothetical protein